MALSITVPGGEFHLSGNPLWVLVQGGSAPAGSSGYKVLLKIVSEDGLLIGSPFIDAIAPDASGQCWFDVSGYVDQPETKQFEFPLTGGLNPYSDLTKEIHFIPGESYIDENDQLQESWGSASSTHHMISGGVSPRKLGKYNDTGSNFYTDFVTGGKFLTWMPENQSVAPFQPVKLWLLAAGTTGVTLHIKAVYEDETFHEHTVTHTLYANILHEINVLPYHSDSSQMAPVKPGNIKMVYYQVWIAGSTETRTFTVDHNPYENCNYILASNSLGGIKINSGFKTAPEMEALCDLLLSKQVWLLRDAAGYNGGTLIPVTVESSEAVLYDTTRDLYSVVVVFKEAQNSEYL